MGAAAVGTTVVAAAMTGQERRAATKDIVPAVTAVAAKMAMIVVQAIWIL